MLVHVKWSGLHFEIPRGERLPGRVPGAGRKVREEALRVRPASGSLLISDFNNVLGICIQKRLLFRALLLILFVLPLSLSVSFSLSLSLC